jgi:hypothetical protein
LLTPLRDSNSTSICKEISILLLVAKDLQLYQHHQEILVLPTPPKKFVIQATIKKIKLCQQ